MNFRLVSTSLGYIALFLQLQVGAANDCRAQEQKDKEKQRPRIGLVLGGGGARGAAHVGILKVIEQERIPIDYVVGTSMGAIVGGAYASGMSPAEIENTLNSVDWKDIFVDDAPRTDLPFRRKRDERQFTGVEIGIRDGKILAPAGAFAGRKLEFLLQKVFLHTSSIDRFDDLDIPFRAVATNIETGEPVVLSSGSLPLAIRASMSIPGAFAPVEIKGNLVDGYVSNNVPVNVAQTLGADVIIAVDVGTPLAKKEDLNTLLDILNQVGGIATIKNVEEQLRYLSKGDILIRPDLGNHATTDFQEIGEIIPLGEKAARDSIAELKKYSVSEEEYQQYLARQRMHPSDPIFIKAIEISPTKFVSKERIEARITLKPGDELDLQTLSRDLTDIQSIGEFQSTGFSLAGEGNDRTLLINAREKSWGPDYLRFGFNLNSNFEGDNFFNFLVDHRIASVNKLGGEWENQLQFGRVSKVVTQFYQPLDYDDRFFISPNAGIIQNLRDIYVDNESIAEYRTRRYGGGADVGYNYGSAAEFRTGIYRGQLKADVSTGAADLPDFDFQRADVHFGFTYDQVDDSNFPRHGGYFRATEQLEREALGSDASYERTEFVGAYAMSNGRSTWFPKFQLGLNPNNDMPFFDDFVLGGPTSLSGYRVDELFGRQMALAKMAYYFQLFESTFAFARSSYLGGSLDAGNTWQELDQMKFDDLTYGGSLFYGADTIMGPLYIGWGINNDTHDSQFFFSLGQRL